MLMLIDCSSCRTALQLPPGARYIRCAVCQAITRVADPLPPPTQPPAAYSTTSRYLNYSGPSNPSPSSGQMPLAKGSKRAVICGILYKKTRHELKGCINDAKAMKHLLITKFSFPEASIRMLTEEEETHRSLLPTKPNIIEALNWLVRGCESGDSLVFFFSGHGSQQRKGSQQTKYAGDEIDGCNETLQPLDFEKDGEEIVDDEIYTKIVKPIPDGVRLHAIIDAGHSGTMLDLPFLCRMNSIGRYAWEDHSPLAGVFKGTNGGEVISLSACDDDQSSSDTASLSKVTSTGAMTFSFIQAIEQGYAKTYGDLLTSMKTTIRKIESDVPTSLLGKLINRRSLGGGLRQDPQLTASEPFDIYTKQFSL